MAAPSMTLAGSYDVASAATLAAGGTNTYTIYNAVGATLNIDVSVDYEIQLQVKVVTGGTVAATAGFKVFVYQGHQSKTAPVFDTLNPLVTYQSAQPAASTTYIISFSVPCSPGLQIQITNIDATNAVTVSVAEDRVSGVA